MNPLDFLHGLGETGFLEIYRNYLLMPMAGVAIYAMKRWSYPVFFGSWVWCIAGNYLAVRQTLAMQGEAAFLPAGREAASIVLNLILIGYFFLPRVRAAYFKPNIRWWEHQPRYLLTGISATLRCDEHKYSGEVENISFTGIKWKPESSEISTLAPGDCVQIAFEFNGSKYQINGQVIRVDSVGSLGIQLLHSARSRRELKALIKQFRSAQFERQSLLTSMYEEFQDLVSWVKSLRDEPESLLPQLQQASSDKKK
jgi:hypothetical protein